MMIRDASDAEIERVLEETHALWSDGMDREDYVRFIRSLMSTAWARSGHYRFLAMVDPAGDLACAMKLYRLDARVEGRRCTLGGVGAVFTLPRHRRRGHAAALLEQAHAWMREGGDAASLLHSEIGSAYYEKLGYRPLDPAAIMLQVFPATPDPRPRLRVLGAGGGSDLDQVMALRREEDADRAFVLERDPSYWEILRARVEVPMKTLGSDRWESRLTLDPDRGFLWSLLRDPAACAHDGGAAARILEVAEKWPGAALPGLLDDLFAICRRRGIMTIEAWNGDDLARRDPRLAAGGAAAPRRLQPLPVVPMWKPLHDATTSGVARALAGAPLHLSEVF